MGDGAMSDENAKGTVWLARNARHVGTEKWEDAKGTESWDRATTEGRNADLGPEDGLGRCWAKLSGGEIHQLLLVKSGGEYVGSCDCEGFQYNQDHPCAHLCTLRFCEWESNEMGSGDVEVPESHEYVRELLAAGEQGGREASESDESESEGAGDPSDAPVSQGTPQPPEQTDDAFANPLPEVDDKFVIEMDGSNYVRKAGYARLLRQQGWEVGRDVVQWSHESDEKRSVVEARIVDPQSGRVLAEALGTAGPPEAEDMSGAEWNLDELAETRAWTRAASIATGEGMTALSEVHPDKEVSEGV